MSASSVDDLAALPHIPVLVHLTGRLRGTTRRLTGDLLKLGTAPETEIHFPADHADEVAPVHASLYRVGNTWELRTMPGREVWVNGEPIERAILDTDDLVEVGAGGPVLRYRLYGPGSSTYKSMAEAFADCVDCARIGSDKPLERTSIFLQEMPREIAREVSPWWRLGVLVLLVALAFSTLMLLRRSRALEERLEQGAQQVAGISELFEIIRREALRPQDLDELRRDLESEVFVTADRLAELEEQVDANRRVISSAARSVVFLQGAYGFVEQTSGKPLRLLLGPNGQPQFNPLTGSPAVGTEGEGPPIEAFYTGTGFVATEEGLLFTNRHVALPWEYEEAAQAMASQGFLPRTTRFVGYLPNVPEPLEVELVVASDEADVALLKSRVLPGDVAPLLLAETLPVPGDGVIVLGYPTGIRALLARTDANFLAQLEADETGLDFWAVARRLAASGHIAPLATRGIVGQTTAAALVYDAETTSGGSGGPVLDLTGRVVAINTAVLPQFGGSNLGTPADHARALLELAERLVDAPPASTPPPLVLTDPP